MRGSNLGLDPSGFSGFINPTVAWEGLLVKVLSIAHTLRKLKKACVANILEILSMGPASTPEP